jgi:hypothetical protein
VLLCVSACAGPQRSADASFLYWGKDGKRRLAAHLKSSLARTHRCQLGDVTTSRHAVRTLGRVSPFFSKRVRNRRFARKRFARDSRQRRDAVARRWRVARHASNTLCSSCFACRRLVWITPAAHLAVRVCRQPPTKCRDQLKASSGLMCVSPGLGLLNAQPPRPSLSRVLG